MIKAKGNGEAAAVQAIGLARAAGFEAQVDAIGSGATAIVAVANEVSGGHDRRSSRTSSSRAAAARFEGLAATLMQQVAGGNGIGGSGAKAKSTPDPEPERKPEAKAPPAPHAESKAEKA